MRRGNPHTIKGKGFDAHPEHINRKGAPKKLPALDQLLADVLGSDGKGKSKAQAVLEALLKRALSGDVRAAEVLLDRGYGKVLQKIAADINNVPQLPDVIITPRKQ